MIITDIETVLLTGPCTNDPFLSEARKRRSAAFIRIRTDAGITGLGETYAGYFFPEGVPPIVDFFKPVLMGQPLDDVESIETLRARMFHCGNFWCRVGLGLIVLNGIEAALWDLLGHARQRPVHELLGGSRHESLPCYATGGPSNYPSEKLAQKVEHYLSLGFQAVKIGAGGFGMETGWTIATEPAQAADFEAEKITFLRERFGPRLQVMMDAHMGNSPGGTAWGLETALAVAKALEPLGLEFLEEPLHYSRPADYAQLCRETGLPIAGGECLTGMDEWDRFIALDSFDIGQPDASFTGGLAEFMKVAAAMAERGRSIATHAWGAGGSLMQNLHCGFAAGNTRILEIPPDYGGLHSEIIVEPLRLCSGRLTPPVAPGLGIHLPESVIRKYPFIPGSGEFNSVPGKVLTDE